MYLRKCRHRLRGKTREYWQLVESYQTERGPRQRVVAYLGAFAEAERLGVAESAAGYAGQSRLFAEEQSRWVEIDPRRVRVEHPRRFGGRWLAQHLWQLLQFPETVAPLLPPGQEDIRKHRDRLCISSFHKTNVIRPCIGHKVYVAAP
jgi:hypothetical protein